MVLTIMCDITLNFLLNDTGVVTNIYLIARKSEKHMSTVDFDGEQKWVGNKPTIIENLGLVRLRQWTGYSTQDA
jgi:hypothetical protein